MKSAYELAMERLEEQEPTKPLSEEQKKEIADIEERAIAKKAERKVFLEGEIVKAQAAGQFEEEDQLRRQLAGDLLTIEEEAETKKAKVRGD